MPSSSIRYLSAGALQLVVLFASGNPGAQEQRAPRDGLVLIYVRPFSYENGVDDIKDEVRMTECVGRSIRSAVPDQQVYSFDQLRKIAFPELSLASAPHSPEYLGLALAKPEIRLRVESAGIRYIAYLGGITQIGRPQGFAFCPNAGCFALVHWNHVSDLGAEIVDLNDDAKKASMDGIAQSRAWLAMAGGVPLGMPANTEGPVCEDLGMKMGKYFREQEKP